MRKIFTLIIILFLVPTIILAQANPSVAILPVNPGGVVGLGATMDVKITINNTLSGSIPAAKLRPVITIPSIATILPTPQQTGLPAGWTVVTNTGGQIRVCNSSDVIGGNEQRDIIIKVQGTTVGGPSICQVQMNYGGSTCTVSGPQPSGNNTVDDFATSSITVVPGCNLTISATAGTILCNGGNTSITVSTTNATGPVEYSITGADPFQSSNVFNNVSAGTYQVTAREVNNPVACAVSTNLAITEPSALQAPALDIVQPDCSTPNGVLTITSTTTDLVFSIDGGLYSAYPAGGYSLAPGSYTISAKNSNDCISPVTNFTINPQPSTPAAPVIGTITQPGCAVSTGSVELNNLPPGNWTIQPGVITGNTSSTVVGNLPPATYIFTVTNDEGCTSAASTPVTIMTVTNAPEAPVVSITQPTCTLATGSVVITSDVTGLTFSLDGGSFIAYPAGGFTGLITGTHTLVAQNISGCLSPSANITINTQPVSPAAPTIMVQQPDCTIPNGMIIVTSSTSDVTFSLDGGNFISYPAGGFMAAPGIHQLAVQNTSGCSPTIINNIIINNQPATPVVNVAFSPITCFGSSTVLDVNATGGVLPYEYSLNGAPYAGSGSFTIPSGTYSVDVRDANGCTGNSGAITVTQPDAISATASSTPVACFGGNTTITVNAAGGTGNYEYSVNGGNFQASNTFPVLAGTYNIQIREAGNPTCVSISNPVVVVSQPAVLTATAVANAITDCGGESIVNVTAIGGTVPFTGTGTFNREPGTWLFTVTDSRGCNTTAEVIIMPPGCVEIKVYPNPAQHKISIDHSAAAQGSALLLYGSNGALLMNKMVLPGSYKSDLDISFLPAGTYLLAFKNGNDWKQAKFIKTHQ